MLRTLVQEGCLAIPEVFPFLARVLRERKEGGDFMYTCRPAIGNTPFLIFNDICGGE